MFPLDGVLVLDMARGYPGAYSTMFLGDFGADIIRIDPPAERTASHDALTREAAFNTVHRNKRSMVINLQKDSGRDVFYRLVSKADILLEGFRPGVMKRLKADYDTLKEINHRLIYCSASGFGQTGPYKDLPAHDMNFIAIGGLLSQIGNKRGAPTLPSNFLADMAGAGLHGVIGILLALVARDKTGRGQHVDISYLDGALSLLAYDAPQYFGYGYVPKRGESNYTGGLPCMNVYKCKDGEYITVATLEAHLYANLCNAIGRPDLISKQYNNPEENDRIIKIFSEIFATKARNEWWEFFKDKNTCVAPVNYLNEAFNDPQVIHRNMVIEIPHSQLGKVKQLGIPIKLSETPGQIRNLGVPSGTNTREILSEVGYSETEIENLISLGAV